jgi:DNA-binding NtrC family response regulator
MRFTRDCRFRGDIFDRLNVIWLQRLPLRERRDEIPALVRHFPALSAAEFKNDGSATFFRCSSTVE